MPPDTFPSPLPRLTSRPHAVPLGRRPRPPHDPRSQAVVPRPSSAGGAVPPRSPRPRPRMLVGPDDAACPAAAGPARPRPRRRPEGGGATVLPPHPAPRPPRRSSGDVVLRGRRLSARGARPSARRREGRQTTPARGSSSPHAAGPRVHRPRRHAPCQVRGTRSSSPRGLQRRRRAPPTLAAARPRPERDLPCEARFRLREKEIGQQFLVRFPVVLHYLVSRNIKTQN